MFKEQQIDMEQVANRLCSLVAPAGSLMIELGTQKAYERLLTQARRIITGDVAKRLAEEARKDKSLDISILLKKERLQRLSPECVYIYVRLLADAVDDGIPSQRSVLMRFQAVMGGYRHLAERAGVLEENKRFFEAEKVRRFSLACLRLHPYPNYKAMFCLYYLAVNLNDGQNRPREAYDCLQQALSEYNQLDAEDQADPEIKEVKDQVVSAIRVLESPPASKPAPQSVPASKPTSQQEAKEQEQAFYNLGMLSFLLVKYNPNNDKKNGEFIKN